MIGRLTWYAVMLLIARVTTLLQMDRQTELTPGLAQAVPVPFRNFAQTRVTAAAVTGEDASRAITEAERLVHRRPLPAEYLTILAVAQAKGGQQEESALTIQIGAQRGWRDPVAQEAMLRIALAAGDQSEAARRYMALFLRPSTPGALLRELGPVVLGDADGAGRGTIVAIVTGTDRWHAYFLRRGLAVMPSDAFAAIVAESVAKGATFDCAGLSQTIDLLQRRDTAAAAQLTRAAQGHHCPSLGGTAGKAL